MAICHVDGRDFGFAYTPREDRTGSADPRHQPVRVGLRRQGDRRRRRRILAAGDGAWRRVSVPMGGVTWVSTAATHRRQGLLTQLMARTLADIDRRGEPVAMLGASEGWDLRALRIRGGNQMRATSIDRRLGSDPPGVPTEAWHACGSSMATRRWRTSSEVWSRFHRQRAGEVDRSEAWHRFLFDVRATEPRRGFSPAFYLAHRDGYAVYRIEMHWNDGQPAHNLRSDRVRGERPATLTPRCGTRCWASTSSARSPHAQVPDRRSVAVSVDQPARAARRPTLARRLLGQRPRCRRMLLGAHVWHRRIASSSRPMASDGRSTVVAGRRDVQDRCVPDPIS